MRGSWWRWLSAVLAIIFGLAFGWVAGTGVAQTASMAAVPVLAATDDAQRRCCANHDSMRFQPSSASSLR